MEVLLQRMRVTLNVTLNIQIHIEIDVFLAELWQIVETCSLLAKSADRLQHPVEIIKGDDEQMNGWSHRGLDNWDDGNRV